MAKRIANVEDVKEWFAANGALITDEEWEALSKKDKAFFQEEVGMLLWLIPSK